MSTRKTVSLVARLSVVELFLRGAKFLFFVLLANSVAKGVFGSYNYIAAWLAVIFVLSDFGITKRITILVAKRDAEVGSLLVVRLSLFVLCAALALLFVRTDVLLYALVAAVFLLDGVFEMLFAIYRGSEQYLREYFTKLAIAAIYLIMAMVVWWQGLDIYAAFGLLGAFYFALFLVRIGSVRSYFAAPWHLRVAMTRENLHLFLALLFTMLYLRIDVIMLGVFLDTTSVAEYSIAAKIVEVAMIVPFAVSNVLLTKFIKYRKFQGSELSFHLFLGIALSLLFMFVSPWMIAIFFPKYEASMSLAQILSAGIVFIMINNYLFTKFIAKDRSHLYMMSTLVMFMSNFVLNLIFIPRYGSTAAALTTLATEAIGSGVAWSLARHDESKML